MIKKFFISIYAFAHRHWHAKTIEQGMHEFRERNSENEALANTLQMELSEEAHAHKKVLSSLNFANEKMVDLTEKYQQLLKDARQVSLDHSFKVGELQKLQDEYGTLSHKFGCIIENITDGLSKSNYELEVYQDAIHKYLCRERREAFNEGQEVGELNGRAKAEIEFAQRGNVEMLIIDEKGYPLGFWMRPDDTVTSKNPLPSIDVLVPGQSGYETKTVLTPFTVFGAGYRGQVYQASSVEDLMGLDHFNPLAVVYGNKIEADHGSVDDDDTMTDEEIAKFVKKKQGADAST